nr:CPBP family intramembrane glutamic endopeptidase [Phytoactinopolyspora alkaliphila]
MHVVLEPGGWADVLDTVTSAVLWGSVLVAGLITVVLSILAFTAVRDGSGGGPARAPASQTWIAVAVVGYLILLTSVSGRIRPLPVFESLEHHWQGKVLDLLWLAILFGILHRWARTEAGLRWRIEPGSARPAVILVAGVFVLFVGLTVLSVGADAGSAEAVSAERFAYNATIPNLTEEFIWRGAMLAVFARVFSASRTVLGAPVGWGIVITSVIFGLGHTILIDLSGNWSVNVAGGIFATVMGLLLGWIWARTGSIWPAFLLHCAPEVGLDIGMILMG